MWPARWRIQGVKPANKSRRQRLTNYPNVGRYFFRVAQLSAIHPLGIPLWSGKLRRMLLSGITLYWLLPVSRRRDKRKWRMYLLFRFSFVVQGPKTRRCPNPFSLRCHLHTALYFLRWRNMEITENELEYTTSPLKWPPSALIDRFRWSLKVPVLGATNWAKLQTSQ